MSSTKSAPGAASSLPKAPSRRPNILLITSDQHRADCYGFAGRKVYTPHLDLLRRQGTWLRNCITPSVVCQPARASMLTGLLPLTHGVSDNGIDLEEGFGQRGFAAQLGRMGYRTGFVGKAHFSTYKTYQPTGRPECIESSQNFAPDWTGPYMGFDHVEMMLIGHNWFLPEAAPRGLHYERWYHGDGMGAWKNELYKTALAPDTQTPQTFHSALPVAWHNTTWVTDRSIEFIREHQRNRVRAAQRVANPSLALGESAGNQEEPFMLWASYPDPHHPFDAPQPWSRLHAPADVDLPRHRQRDLARRPWWHRAALESPSMDKPGFREIREAYSRIGELDERQLRELIANYYGMISMIDDGVGRILTALHDAGLDDNTLVIFTSDHGDWLGDHGLMLKGPMMYDGLLRVGALVRGPGVPAGGTVLSPVSTLDLTATLTDYAANLPGAVKSRPSSHPAQATAAHPSDAESGHGKSWRALLESGGKESQRDFALNEWALGPARCGVALDLQTVRTEHWRMTLEHGSSAGEMYDLQHDPDEMHNLFDDPAYREDRAALTDMLHQRPGDRLAVQTQPIGQA